ncbi:MAG: hypothetical protein H6Q69_4517 [Firmicutes bacterium]|nr:hypothetical protein [Bacillota bacterium]
MVITKSVLEGFATKLLDNELKVEDIPSIKQYADQVTELLNSKLNHRRKGDVVMIMRIALIEFAKKSIIPSRTTQIKIW